MSCKNYIGVNCFVRLEPNRCVHSYARLVVWTKCNVSNLLGASPPPPVPTDVKLFGGDDGIHGRRAAAT